MHFRVIENTYVSMFNKQIHSFEVEIYLTLQRSIRAFMGVGESNVRREKVKDRILKECF